MSECVVRMEMPQNGVCDGCGAKFVDSLAGSVCAISKKFLGSSRPSWCPIICQLPEEHGRLVDVAVLKNKNMRKPRGVSSYDYGAMATVFMDAINDTPTIVPAERSET